MVTVSTSKTSERTYHHGDLRSALVEAGLKALETTAVEDLSLRQLARETGVSPTAVYRHFPDKRALLTALGWAGIDALGRFQQEAVAKAGEAEAFAASGRAYVRFALAHPGLFRLIFSHIEPDGETVFGSSLPARMLQEKVAQVTGNPDAARKLTLQAWALVHGLSMLMLDRQVPEDDELIDAVIDPSLLFGGYGRRSEESP